MVSIEPAAGQKHSLENWNKVHLCGLLSIRFGLTRFLEITTTLTGYRYAEALQLGFTQCMRIVYRLQDGVRDDLPMEFTSPNDDISTCLTEIRRRGITFNLIFVDPHHTYECSLRDIMEAFALLEPGGAMVIHDCRPPNKATAAPHFVQGEWCGVTYKAFLDFVLGNPKLDYFTFDADYGCGVILKPRSLIDRIKNNLRARSSLKLALDWRRLGNDFDAAFDKFKSNEEELLRLTSFAALRTKLKN